MDEKIYERMKKVDFYEMFELVCTKTRKIGRVVGKDALNPITTFTLWT